MEQTVDFQTSVTFPRELNEIEARIQSIDPVLYARTRNFEEGAVTRLSPYISRGVISTKQVFDHVMSLDLAWEQTEKFVQELAWRDYWQQVWISKGDLIDSDLKQEQQPVTHYQVPDALLQANTGIEAVDRALKTLFETGYMHNHTRMYVAAIACNFGQSQWRQPARWMYYHLLDGDWASNALSWQWVAGANANKKYYANQENVNKYFNSIQRGTIMDRAYKDFAEICVPEELKATSHFNATTSLPTQQELDVDAEAEILIYNYYNLDPHWHANHSANRVLLLEPSFFEKYPVSQKCLEFVLDLSKNIPGIQVFVGEFQDLKQVFPTARFTFKEHPTNAHYSGKEEPRDWMADVQGYFPSFFAFWKKYKKKLV
ncbi:MAG: FAD-binding domain-containing protein [Cytophagales bacterium]|nr:FAD-binding domain-containing protein [Cytophagales bacterium]